MSNPSHVVTVKPGEAFRIILRGAPSVRERVLVNFDPALGKVWTTANKTLDRSIDANGALAVLGDGIASLVDDLIAFMPGLFNRAGSGTATLRSKPIEYSISPGETLQVVQRAGNASREVVLLNIDPDTAGSWTTTNGTTDRSVDANGAIAGLGDNMANLVDDLKLLLPGMMDTAGNGNGRRSKPQKVNIGSNNVFRVVYDGGDIASAKSVAERSVDLLNVNLRNGVAWTTSNVTTNRAVDANDAADPPADMLDNLTTLVEDLKVWMPGLFNKA